MVEHRLHIAMHKVEHMLHMHKVKHRLCAQLIEAVEPVPTTSSVVQCPARQQAVGILCRFQLLPTLTKLICQIWSHL